MPVPDYQTLILPLLTAFADGLQSVRQVMPGLRVQFDITDDEAAEMLPSGRVTSLQNRAH